jgi:hypothetical protein
MPPDDAVERYHAVLAGDGVAEETARLLAAALEDRRLVFGTRPLCDVLRPRFLTPERERLLRDRAGIVASALRRVQDLAADNSALLHQFRLLKWEHELFPIPAHIAHPCPVSRLDGFFASDGRLRFTEMNAQSPAGAGYSDAIAEVFAELPAMRALQNECRLRPYAARDGTLAALRAAWRDWSGVATDPPHIAIVDWPDVPTRREFELLRDRFESAGIPTRILAPADLDFDGRTLAADGQPIRLLYRRVLMVELIQRCGLDHPLIQAARAGAACIVNPISCRLPGKKASFAVLSDETNAEFFTPVQRAAIRDTIPWTRLLEERRTKVAGQDVELIPFVVRNRDRLVLKPNDSHGGRSVVLGWTVDDAAWESAVNAALAVPTIVQERIDLACERYPVYTNGRLAFEPRWEDTCPFVGPDDGVFGCLSRLSTVPLVNVTAGGGAMVPTFVLEK